jgi:uracil-DNA glycosylase
MPLVKQKAKQEVNEQGAAPFVPKLRTLPALREAVQHCRGCDLYKRATQAVFGELETGATADASKVQIMMIGEQPGDREDKQGRPFVGPAGGLLDKCLQEAGIDRQKVYVTNTVKHFKWEPRGKLRIHKKPSMQQVHACRPWLDAELETVRPELIVCLGAVAAQSLLGPRFKITQSHGMLQQVAGLPPVIATQHPSSILRARTDEDRHREKRKFVDDLRQVAAFLRPSTPTAGAPGIHGHEPAGAAGDVPRKPVQRVTIGSLPRKAGGAGRNRTAE